MEVLKYEEIPEARKKLDSVGVATESLNRLPVFQPTMKPREEVRVFENKYGKLLVKGRLGQPHKNLLETILWKKELHDYFRDGDTRYLKVLYDKQKVRKYLSQSQKSKYSQERYEALLEDMMRTIITLETEKVKIQGPLIIEINDSPVLRTVASKSPIIPNQVPLTTIKFGAIATALLEKELKFTYDPKPVMKLSSGISQALVRYLLTHRSHPQAGYHLRELIANLIENAEGQKWKDIKKALKEDAKLLETIGIAINFEEDRLFVIKDLLNSKSFIGG
jgi:hypothetical protein